MDPGQSNQSILTWVEADPVSNFLQDEKREPKYPHPTTASLCSRQKVLLGTLKCDVSAKVTRCYDFKEKKYLNNCRYKDFFSMAQNNRLLYETSDQ